jgi:hypothetical protein
MDQKNEKQWEIENNGKIKRNERTMNQKQQEDWKQWRIGNNGESKEMKE